jgi:type I restriction enzyme M protein
MLRIAADWIPRAEIMKMPSAQDSAVIHQHIGPRNADSFRVDLHPDLKADFVSLRKDLATATRASAKATLAKPHRRSVGETELHPPFNMSDWGGENLRHDLRWKFGMPPVNTNYAWIQHFIHHLSPVGVAGFIMAKITRKERGGLVSAFS